MMKDTVTPALAHEVPAVGLDDLDGFPDLWHRSKTVSETMLFHIETTSRSGLSTISIATGSQRAKDEQ